MSDRNEKKKRIVILRSNSVNPDSRVEKEARSLSEAGYKVTVYAWDRDSLHKIHSSKLFEDLDVTVNRIGYKASYGEGMKNIKPFILFQLSIIRFLIKNRQQIDVVHACDFDTAFCSFFIAKLLRKKFVFDIFDFIFGEPINSFQSFIKKLQLFLISHADATIICSEDRIRQISGSTPRKLCVIHNSPADKQFTSQPNRNEIVTIVYVGILQDYRLLLEIGEFFSEHEEFHLNIGGFGKYESYFKDLASRCSNITFWGRIPYELTLALENEADIMLAIYDPKIENHRYAAPNKFYEALMLGKPLIMVKGTGMSEEIGLNDIGEVIDYSKEGFEKGIISLLNRQNEWNDIALRMKTLYREKYSWNEMKERLVSLYTKL